MNVETVKQGTAETRPIDRNTLRRACAPRGAVTAIPARVRLSIVVTADGAMLGACQKRSAAANARSAANKARRSRVVGCGSGDAPSARPARW
jgi:hypothetical protein